MHRVLFVVSEAHPLIKTGGLADVAGSLPPALKAQDCDVRVLLPGYPDAIKRAGMLKTIARLTLPGADAPVQLLEGLLPGTRVKVWLLDHPPAYGRPGNPYLNPAGHDWHDNAQRFALLAHAATRLALGDAGLAWQADVVHCHDWQTGLVPVLLSLAPRRPATVFTIHNLAYRGLFPHSTLAELDLPSTLWSHEALEFHGQLAFIKGGLVFADRINTVSPTYAIEIQTPEHGCGLEGLLSHRSDRLSGILNGIDEKVWNPTRDENLAAHYDARRLANKRLNKEALQREFSLPVAPERPLFASIGRLVPQKGVDLILDALPHLLARSAQVVILGSGDAHYEHALLKQAHNYREHISVRIGFDEGAAHRIEAGADIFLMPSRFEPCGLNQMYSQRYGTVPIVRRVGGLADTVVDATPAMLAAGTATGFAFDGDALIDATDRALALYRDPRTWTKIMRIGMRRDFGWRHSAKQYVALYETAIADAELN